MVKNLETKRQIRTRALKRRRALTEDLRDRYSQKIRSLTVMHPLFQSAREIYCYASLPDEVWTAGLMDEAWKLGKRVAVPRVTDEGKMDFFYIESPAELSPGYYGILEPAQDVGRLALPKSISKSGMHPNSAIGESQALVLLPGAAFDKKGNRIGYGKGFYDRYLHRFPKCRRIGLAYSIQCVEEIPAEPLDTGVEAVITEKGNYMI